MSKYRWALISVIFCFLTLSAKAQDGCLHEFQNFCEDLYSSQHLGNAEYNIAEEKKLLLFGNTENGGSYAEYFFFSALLKNKEDLPKDLKLTMEHENLFSKSQEVIDFKINLHSKTSQLLRTNLIKKYNQSFSFSLENVLNQRLLKKFPDYDLNDSLPSSVIYAKADERKELSRQFNVALWENSPQWKKIEKQFGLVQKTYLEYLNENSTFPQSLKDRWIKRIETTQLVLPYKGNNSVSGCDTSSSNALYMPLTNEFTVCAGLFNTTENIETIIAHELGHALDPLSERIQANQNASLNQLIFGLEKEICTQAPLNHCPKNFMALKDQLHLQSLLDGIPAWTPYSKDFYSCLQYKSDSLINQSFDQVHKVATSELKSTIGKKADQNIFLELIKKEDFNEFGDLITNQFYLNPCRDKKPTENEFVLGGSNQTDLFFTAAYLCEDSKLSQEEKLRSSIQTASDLSSKIWTHLAFQGGAFSPDPLAIYMGMSENTVERFADSLAAEITTRLMKKEQLSLESRRKKFFYSNSLFCVRPSLNLRYPTEAQIQKSFSQEPHSKGLKRMAELLSPPIREILECQSDFPFQAKDCHP